MLTLPQKLEFIKEIDKLKSILRVNRLANGQRRENSAEHSWHLGMMALVLQDYVEEPSFDLLKALKIALIHDLVEIDAGDTYAFDMKAHADKEEREHKAAERLFTMLPPDIGQELHSLWFEYEDGNTPEARFIGALDRLHPFLQHMANEGIVWRERQMHKSLLLTRMIEVKHKCPALWPVVESSIETAIANGWLLPH